MIVKPTAISVPTARFLDLIFRLRSFSCPRVDVGIGGLGCSVSCSV